MLALQNISRSFAGPKGLIEVFRDMSLEIKTGDFVSIRGESGSGKTTLMLMASGLLQPDRGAVLFNGKNLYSLTAKERTNVRCAEIGFVFQELLLLPYLTVFENVLAASVPRKIAGTEKRAEELLLRFSLTGRGSHYPSQLSTGEKQRVAFARALMNSPKILFADEPTGNLDPENARRICGYFDEFVGERGTVVLVTHDKAVAARAAIRLALSAGKLTKES